MYHLKLEVPEGRLPHEVDWLKETGFTYIGKKQKTLRAQAAMADTPAPPAKPTYAQALKTKDAGDDDSGAPVKAAWITQLTRGLVTIQAIARAEPLDTVAVEFCTGNPAVEVHSGVLRLLHEKGKMDSRGLPVGRLPVVCVLAAPSHIPASDFISFCGGYQQFISHMRIIRDSSPNRYMVVLTFREQQHADDYYAEYNNRPFSSLEPETAHLGFVASMELFEADVPYEAFMNLTELPTCPVCLERMDASATGIMMIQCNHSFHCACLKRWADSSCPVCRYASRSTDDVNACFECDASDNLWICLICGYVGCGRYADGHAYQHFLEKGHSFSMHLETGRVWDYVGDGYVHRLVQNKVDGKLVELPDPSYPIDARVPGQEHVEAAKIESIAKEFNHLLVTQLDSQRAYYESELSRRAREEGDSLKEELKVKDEVIARLEKHVAGLEGEKKGLGKKVTTMQAKLTKLTEDFDFMQQINANMLADQKAWQEKLAEAEERMDKRLSQKDGAIAELQATVRDLMFSLEGRERVEAEAGAEGGTLIITDDGTSGGLPSPGPADASPALSGRGRRKKRNKR